MYPVADRTQQAEGAEHRLADRGGIADGSEFDEPDTVGKVRFTAPRGLRCQPGLAGAARPDDGGQPATLEHLRYPVYLAVASDEAGQEGPQVAVPQSFCGRTVRDRHSGGDFRAIWRWQRRNRWGAGHFAAEQGEVDRPQIGAGVDTEPVGESPAQLLVGSQRIGGAAVGGQCAHQLTGEPLAQGVRGEKLRELGDHVRRVTEPEISLNPVGVCYQPLLAQPRRPGHCVGRIPRVGQRFLPATAPAPSPGCPGRSVSRRPSTADARW